MKGKWKVLDIAYSISALLKAFVWLEMVLEAVSGLAVYAEILHPYAKLITLVILPLNLSESPEKALILY